MLGHLADVGEARSFAPQGQAPNARLQQGSYQVVMSRPIQPRGWPGGSAYVEDRALTELFVQLERDGLVPVFTQVVTDRTDGTAPQDRLVVVCRRP